MVVHVLYAMAKMATMLIIRIDYIRKVEFVLMGQLASMNYVLYEEQRT